jgi:hypothetical protein
MKESKMSVYVLTAATAYEGEDLVGVYASLEEAQAASVSYATRSESDDRTDGFCAGGDYYNVYCIEVGRPGRWYGDDQVVWCSVV